MYLTSCGVTESVIFMFIKVRDKGQFTILTNLLAQVNAFNELSDILCTCRHVRQNRYGAVIGVLNHDKRVA